MTTVDHFGFTRCRIKPARNKGDETIRCNIQQLAVEARHNPNRIELCRASDLNNAMARAIIRAAVMPLPATSP